ncbi:MAG: bifunctional DNA primase/polymerase, partial [Chloroflexota bacterium]|nr:bifunctional DNA primase/polymerase [Chloroflexota bacterium]
RGHERGGGPMIAAAVEDPAIDHGGDPDLLAAALEMAERAIPAFPCWPINADGVCACPKGATCGKNAGKHPLSPCVPRGLLDASSDARALTEWWLMWPDANLAGVTGPDSGLLVLDIDPDADGWESLDALLLAAYGPDAPDYDPATWSVETGSGGLHVYFRYPDGLDIRNSAGKLGPGLDVRAAGGYVLLPPSLHRSGNRYRWADGYDPDSTPLADPPTWLLSRIAQPATPTKRAPCLADGEPIKDGSRNTTLTSWAGSMRRRGMSEEAIRLALSHENDTRCKPPLDAAEVAKIAHSVAGYAPAAESEAVILPNGVVLHVGKRRAHHGR